MAGFYPDDNDPLTPWLGLYGNRRLVGRGRGSPAGMPVQAREADPFSLTRERIGDELASDATLRRDFDANTTAEVGADPAKRRMYQAATIDRAVQSGKPLADVVNAPDYYPPETRRATATTGQGTDPSVWEGANPANYATGNASFDPKTGRWVGFAGGPQTATSGSGRGMELYGIEGQAGLPYARAMGYAGPDRTAIGPQGPQGDPDQAVAGLYDQAREPASYPRREEGKKMPASLMDMLSGKAPLEFSPRDYAGNQIGVGDAIGQNANSLVGLGMGLLQPYRPGESPYANALQGFQAGSVADSRRGYQQAQLAHQKTQDARQAAQDKQAQENWKAQFARGGETAYQKMQADLARVAGTPEEQQVRDFYRSQLDAGPPQTREVFDPALGRNVIQEWDSRSKQYKAATMGGGAPAAGTPTAPGPGGAGAAPQPVLPPKKPLTAHEQTAIDDADKAVIANRAVIGTLQDAQRLSKNAFSGLYPMQRAEIGAQIPDFLPGMSSNQTAKNTLLLHNATISQAVDQLKTVFGGNPSEGERKILLDLAGSVSSPDDVRQKIYEKAIQAANERLGLNQRRAQEIRGGTYYNPGGGAPAPTPQTQQAPTAAPPAPAIRALRNNPKMRDEFDAKYGEGAAMRALRGE